MAHDLTPLKTVNPEKKATIVETPAQRLANLGITLPEPAAPIAAYVPTVEVNGLLHISGQLPFDKSEIMVGRIGEDRDLAYGQAAARACGVMLIAQMQAGKTSIKDMVSVIYADVDKRLHPAACHSVLAHMIRLVQLAMYPTGERQ